MKKHQKPSPLAGKTVRLKDDVFKYGGREVEVRDWWDRIVGYSWQMGIINPVCTHYALRASFTGKSEMFDDEVLYCKMGNLMYLFHVSEIEGE